ncbi:MAG: hypothetical protein NTY23_07995 [Chloroflexi bacterium]|nr:hypothetical protein [Chloroflexota bacterium]
MGQKTVAQKRIIRPGARVLILGASPVTLACWARGQRDRRAVSVRELAQAIGGAAPQSTKGGLYINRDVIWKYARTLGLEGVALIAVDGTWSTMRLKQV